MDAFSRLTSALEAMGQATAIPAGTRGIVFAAIDQLISTHASAERIGIASDISIAIQKLEWAMLRGDERRRENELQRLRALSDRWASLRSVLG